MKAIETVDIVRWLERRGFERHDKTASGHLYYTHTPTGVKLTLINPGRAGRKEVGKRDFADMLRALERCGYERKKVRQELEEER